MPDIALTVRNVGKRYRLGPSRPGGDLMLRDVLTRVLSGPFRRRRPPVAVDHIWALKDVSFEVPRGQILGIIGPNGAGKSTLLKILSRITEPTEGRVEIRGRVGSLLEVGTGFHPELTGRENIYLSGALLGMRKAEIDRKLEEIIAFAEVERFIETPVKYYSSGMYVRLAFGVAAHLEPEILVVDEVLAVGDIAFQRKCLTKMEDVRQHGRTVLFVSHNMQAVSRLCQRVILISNGVVQKDGPAVDVTSAYLQASLRASAERAWPDAGSAPGNDVVRLRRVRVRTEHGATTETVDIRGPIGIELVYDVLEPGHLLIPYCSLFNESGVEAFGTQDLDPDWRGRPRPVGRFTSVVWIPGNLLAEGALLIGAGMYTVAPYTLHFYAADAVAFHVVDPAQGDSARGDWDGTMGGVVRPLLQWTTSMSPTPDGR